MGVQKVRNEEYLLVFAENLKRIRKSKEITQETLAFKSGLSLSQIARIETGKINTSISTVYVLAKALEVRPGELF